MPPRRPNWIARLIYLVVAIYWVALATATHLPRLPQAINMSEGRDKLWHFGGYGTLALFLFWAVEIVVFRFRATPRRRLGVAITVMMVLAAYGAADEITQQFVGRNCELLDWVADMCGCLLALTLSLGLLRAFTKRDHNYGDNAVAFSTSVTNSLR